MTGVLTPKLTTVQRQGIQKLWFAGWNSANRRAREAYEERLAELDRREKGTRSWHARQKARESGVLPEMCRKDRHKLADVGVSWEKRGYWKCKGCINDRNTDKRRAKGVMPRPWRFSPEQCAALRQQYDAGARLADLALQENASVTGVTKAIRRAGGELRRPIDTKRLRRELGEKSA